MKLPEVAQSGPDDSLWSFRAKLERATNVVDSLNRGHCVKYHCLTAAPVGPRDAVDPAASGGAAKRR